MFLFSLILLLDCTLTEGYYLDMDHEKGDVSNHKHSAFFRAGTVLYWLLFVIVLLVAAFWGYLYRPVRVVDKATVVCVDGSNFDAKSAGVYFVGDSEYITTYDDEKLRVFCYPPRGKEATRYYSKSLNKFITASKADLTQAQIDAIEKNYSLNFQYKVQNSVVEAATAFSIVLIVGVLMLEVIKRTLLYIIIGRKFF